MKLNTKEQAKAARKANNDAWSAGRKANRAAKKAGTITGKEKRARNRAVGAKYNTTLGANQAKQPGVIGSAYRAAYKHPNVASAAAGGLTGAAIGAVYHNPESGLTRTGAAVARSAGYAAGNTATNAVLRRMPSSTYAQRAKGAAATMSGASLHNRKSAHAGIDHKSQQHWNN